VLEVLVEELADHLVRVNQVVLVGYLLIQLKEVMEAMGPVVLIFRVVEVVVQAEKAEMLRLPVILGQKVV